MPAKYRVICDGTGYGMTFYMKEYLTGAPDLIGAVNDTIKRLEKDGLVLDRIISIDEVENNPEINNVFRSGNINSGCRNTGNKNSGKLQLLKTKIEQKDKHAQ